MKKEGLVRRCYVAIEEEEKRGAREGKIDMEKWNEGGKSDEDDDDDDDRGGGGEDC